MSSFQVSSPLPLRGRLKVDCARDPGQPLIGFRLLSLNAPED